MTRGTRSIVSVLAVVAIAVSAGAVAVAVGSRSGTRTMVGVVAARGSASVEATDQLGVQDALVVARVVAPGPSWVVVYSEGMNGMPGRVAGRVAVPAGESTGVLVPLDPSVRLSEYAIVTVQADRGVVGTYEFDDARFEESPDKPYWVGGSPVQAKVWVRFYEMGNAFRS